MKFIIIFISILLSLNACSQPELDYTIIPGERVGAITKDIAEAQLVQVYGSENISPVSVYLGEGFYAPGTALFANDSTRLLEIVWKDTTERKSPDHIRIIGNTWKTPEGVSLGTSLKELEELNGKSFTLTGFGWDYSGTIVSWENGKLEKYSQPSGRLIVRLYPKDEVSDHSVYGDIDIMSDNQTMRRLNPTAYQLIAEFR